MAGCYELDEASRSRRGRLYLYKVRGSQPQLLDLGCHDTPGSTGSSAKELQIHLSARPGCSSNFHFLQAFLS